MTAIRTNENEALVVVDGEIELYATYNSSYANLYTSVDGTDYVAFAEFTAANITRNGYTFAKFADAGHNDVTAATTCNTTNEVVIYAQWTPSTYLLTISATLNKVSISVSGSGVTDNGNGTYTIVFDSAVTLQETMDVGYHFIRWSTGGTELGINATLVYPYQTYAPVTITAEVAANTYTVNFNANGGIGSAQSISATYDQAITLDNGAMLTKTGYNLVGWYLDENTTYDLGETINDNLTSTNNGEVTLYAVWEARDYTIAFNTNGGTAVSNLSAVYDEAIEITGTTSREGYDFVEWTTQTGTSTATTIANIGEYADITAYLVGEGAQGGIYIYDDDYYAFNLTPLETTTYVYANWIEGAATYDVEYYTENFDGTYSVEQSDTISEHLNGTIVKTGDIVSIDTSVTFDGFTLDLSNANTLQSAAVLSDSSLTLKLYYTRNVYSLTFVLPAAGVASVSATAALNEQVSATTFKYGAEVTISVTLVKGYTIRSITTGEDVVLNTPTYTFEIEDDTTSTIEVNAQTYEYIVEFKFETLDGTGYAKNTSLADDVTLTARVDTTITLAMIEEVIEDIDGFRYLSFSADSAVKAVVENEDENTIVTVLYERLSFSLTTQVTTGVTSLTAVEGTYVVKTGEDATHGTTTYSVRYEAQVEFLLTTLPGYEFEGWSYAGATGGANAGEIASMPAESVLMYANMTPIKVDITVIYMTETFVAGSYTEHSRELQQRVVYTATEVENVSGLTLKTITGFSYTDFETGVIVAGDGSSTIEVYYRRNEVRIGARMTEGIASVIVSANENSGGYVVNQTFTEEGSVLVKYGAHVTFDYTLTNAGGYTFAGFDILTTTTSVINENEEVTTTTPLTPTAGEYVTTIETDPFTILAKATNNEFEITFNRNGGDAGTMSALTATYNRQVTLSNNTFTRTGYYYLEWNTAADGSGITYANSSTFTYLLTDDLELFAQWNTISYNVAYNANGGTGTMTGHTNVEFDATENLRTNEFALTGYSWNGWTYTDDGGIERTLAANVTTFRNLTAVAGKLVTLYAVWAENSYTLFYDSNYTSKAPTATNVVVEDDDYLYTADITVLDYDDASLDFALTGYSFVGWTLDPADESSIVSAGDILSRLATGAANDDEVTLYAVWSPITYFVLFSRNNGAGQMAAFEVTYDVSTPLPENRFVRTGYTFEGWALTADGAMVYEDEDEVLNLRSVQDDEIVLYAVWETIDYTITYKPNTGEFDESLTLEEDGTYKVGFTIEDSITLVSDDLTKEGFTLVGYSFDGTPAGNWAERFAVGIAFDNLASLTLASGLYGNATLQAVWEINTYTLTINYLFEDLSAAATTYEGDYEFAEAYNISSPAVVGYTPNIAAVSGTMPAEDVVVNVTYSPNTYTIYFDKNDSEGTSRATLNKDDMEVTYDSQYGALATAERAGYTLEGWYFDRGLTQRVLATDVVQIIVNTTLYAKWTANSNTSFYVDYRFEALDGTFAVDGLMTQTGSGTTDTQITESMVKALTSGAYPVVAGFRQTNLALSNLDADGQARVVVTYSRLYYTISVNVTEGVDAVVVTTTEEPTQEQEEDFYIKDRGSLGLEYDVRYGAHVNLVATISNAGYNFVGFTTQDATITTTTATLSGTFEMPAQNVNISAVAEPKAYTIIYHGEQGATSGSATSYTQSGAGVLYNRAVVLNANAFLREGYTFDGWALEAGGAVSYGDGASFTLATYAASIDFYAVWSANQYDLVIDGDQGTDKTLTTIFVDGEVVEYASSIAVYYDNVVRIYHTYTDEEITTTAISKGYDFAGFVVGSSIVSTGAYYEFVVSGNATIMLTTTPRTDTRFMIVYELQDLTNESVYNAVVGDDELAEGETDRTLTYAYISSLNGGAYAKTYAGFGFSSLSSHGNEEEAIVIRYHNDDLEYTTVYMRYVRLHYGVSVDTEGEGVDSIFIQASGNTGLVTPLGEEYRVRYGTPIDLVVVLHEGHTLDRIEAQVTMAQGSVALDGEHTTWTLIAGDDGFYLGSTKIFGFVLDASTGTYSISEMPAFAVDFKTISHANTYHITYHRHASASDATTRVEDVVYNTAYSVYNIETLGWTKDGYEFIGFATSQAHALAKIIDFEFEDENDVDFAHFLYTEDIEFWAMWTAGANVYTIEYYFEDETGEFNIDDNYTAERQENTDVQVSYELLDNLEHYEFDEDNEENVLTGIVGADGPLTLKVYYKRLWYTMSVTYDAGVGAVALSSTDDGLVETTPVDANGYVSASVRWGANVTITPTIRTGYSFTAYAETTSTDTNVSTGIFDMPTGNIYIYASTTPNVYHITFVGNGGSYIDGVDTITSYTQDFDFESADVLTENRFENPGYNFTSWTIVVGADTLTFEDGDTFTFSVPAHLTATANWEAREDTAYMVEYYVQTIAGTYELVDTLTLYGVTDEEITQEDVEAGFAAVQGITLAGYTFASMDENVTITGASVALVRAQYDLAAFNATFTLSEIGIDSVTINYLTTEGVEEGEIEDEQTEQILYSSVVKIKVEALTGFELVSITINGEHTSITFDQNSLDAQGWAIFSMPSEAVSISIAMKYLTYSINYYKNFKSDSFTMTTQEVIYMQENVFLEGNYAETGYTLLGWAETNDGEVVYDVGEVLPTFNFTAPIDLYAKWSANAYTIHFSANGGDGEIADIDTHYDDKTEIPDGNAYFTLLGQKIVGWALGAEGENVIDEVETYLDIPNVGGVYKVVATQKLYAFNLATGVEYDDEITLYAVWAPIEYQITLRYDESVSSAKSELGTFTYGRAYSIPRFETLDWEMGGYEFAGWTYTNDDGQEVWIELAADEAYDIENITAQEREVEFFVKWTTGKAYITVRVLLESLGGQYAETEGNYFDITGLMAQTEDVITSESVYFGLIKDTQYAHVPGFAYNEDSDDSQVVLGNGLTMIRIKYSRLSYNLNVVVNHLSGITLETLSGTFEINDESTNLFKSWAIRYGDYATLTLTPGAGYNSPYLSVDAGLSEVGVELEANGRSIYMKGENGEAGNITLVANAVPNNDTGYTINIYKQQLDGEYDAEHPDYTLYGEGETDSEIAELDVRDIIDGAALLDFVGFEYSGVECDPETINGDESTIVSVYFIRERYTTTINVDNARAIAVAEGQQQYLYEEEASFEFVTNLGYTYVEVLFTDESEQELDIDYTESVATLVSGAKRYTITFAMPAKNVCAMVVSTKNADTQYTVAYKFETTALNGTFVEDENHPRTTRTGETEHILTRADIGYGLLEETGFEIDGTSIDSADVEIAGDGSTIVYIYYSRVRSSVHVELADEDNGLVDGSFTFLVGGVEGVPISNWNWQVAYGQHIVISLQIEAGFEFTSYVVNGIEQTNINNMTLVYTMGDEDLEIVATIIARTDIVYVAEYYVQSSEDLDEFTKVMTIYEQGKAHTHLVEEDIYDRYVRGIARFAAFNSEDFDGQNYSHFLAFENGSSAPIDNSSIRIAGNGTTILKFFFTLKVVEIQVETEDPSRIVRVTITADNETRVISIMGSGSYAYGSRVTIDVEMERGYNFVSYTIIKGTDVDHAETIEIKQYSFTIDTDQGYTIIINTEIGITTYSIEHYFEVLGQDAYGEPDFVQANLEGETDSVIDTTGIDLQREGYILDRIECTVDGFVLAGGSEPVVKVYYILTSVEFTIRYREGIAGVSVTAGNSASDVVLVGGSAADKTMVYRAKYTAKISLSVDLKRGYDFVGWRINGGGIIPHSEEPIGFLLDARSADFELIAEAYTKQIAIRYIANNGSRQSTNETPANYGDTIMIRTNPFTYKRHKFLGWATEKDGNVVYVPGEIVEVNFEENLNLYAVWTKTGKTNILPIIAICGGVLLVGFFLFLILKRRRRRVRETDEM